MACGVWWVTARGMTIKLGAPVGKFPAPVGKFPAPVRDEGDRTNLELMTRYPLFGGWSASFVLGYSVPLPLLVSKVTSSGRYRLNTTFGNALEAGAGTPMVVDQAEIRVALPEGSSDIKIVVLDNIASFYGSSCPNNGKGVLNTPDL
eukprot:3673267-Pyramimonas_sp.AAC.1